MPDTVHGSIFLFRQLKRRGITSFLEINDDEMETMKILDAGIALLLQEPDINSFRTQNREKPKGLIYKRLTEAEAVKRFRHNGDYIGAYLYGTLRYLMLLVNEIFRQGITDLRVAGLHHNSLLPG